MSEQVKKIPSAKPTRRGCRGSGFKKAFSKHEKKWLDEHPGSNFSEEVYAVADIYGPWLSKDTGIMAMFHYEDLEMSIMAFQGSYVEFEELMAKGPHSAQLAKLKSSPEWKEFVKTHPDK